MFTEKIKKISGNLLMNVNKAVNYFGVCVLPGINQYLKKKVPDEMYIKKSNQWYYF